MGGSRPCVRGGGACLRVRDTSCPLAGSREWVREGDVPPPARSAKALKFYHERILIFSTSGLDKIQNSALGHCFSLNRDSCMRYTCTPHVRDAITADSTNITIINDLCTCVLF